MVTKSKDLLQARLERYLDKLKSGEKVNARDLKSVLTSAEIERMQQSWEFARLQKQNVKDMGEELSSYTRRLHTADKIYGIAENHSNLPRTQSKKLINDAEKHYERALEHLEEIVARNIRVKEALDRPVSFGPESENSPCSAGVPRYVFSRAHHTLPREWSTIKSIRIDALEEKLRSLERSDYVQPDSEPDCDDQNTTDHPEGARKLRGLVR